MTCDDVGVIDFA